MSDRNFNQSGGVFQAGHSSSVQIHGGQFVQHNQTNAHNCHEADDGFKHLQAHVATSAFDSPEHVDAPKCHPNTRKAVLDEIMNWILLAVTRIQWVLWLNGAAGAGKSAIGRSIIDLCIQRNIPVARFFFFRTDSTRNNVKPLVATLVHQLFQSIPDLKPIIVRRIESDPLIFTKSLKTQFEFLIFGPLRELKRKSVNLPTLVLLLDGVDECDHHNDQASLIRIIADFVSSGSFPVIAFFGSRAEDQISRVFRSAVVSNITRQLTLDDTYFPDDDIRAFLNDSFNEIKLTHSFAHLLDNWPTAPDVQEIVEKSSGQFIYASVVIKFLSMLDENPEHQLKIVRGLRPRGALTPFAQLDALYRHIFSRVRNINETSRILAWAILKKRENIAQCAEFLGTCSGGIYVALAPLKAVVDHTSDGFLKFLHASLPDFLLDKQRSKEYYIDRSAWSAHLSVMAFNFVKSKGHQGHIPSDMYLTEAEATLELRDHVLSYEPPEKDEPKSIKGPGTKSGYSNEFHKKQLNAIVGYISKNYPKDLLKLLQTYEYSEIRSQIKSESVKTLTDIVEKEGKEAKKHRLLVDKFITKMDKREKEKIKSRRKWRLLDDQREEKQREREKRRKEREERQKEREERRKERDERRKESTPRWWGIFLMWRLRRK